jgi:hypothetical protein
MDGVIANVGWIGRHGDGTINGQVSGDASGGGANVQILTGK